MKEIREVATEVYWIYWETGVKKLCKFQEINKFIFMIFNPVKLQNKTDNKGKCLRWYEKQLKFLDVLAEKKVTPCCYMNLRMAEN